MKKVGILSMILFILAALCAGYFVIIVSYAGFSSRSHLIWAVIAAVLVLSGLLSAFHHRGKIHIPYGILILAGVILVTMAVAFAAAEYLILSNSHTKPADRADYMIVLGARLQGTAITPALRYRLDAALAYASENPDTVIILSGGRGEGESIAEAEAMYGYLAENGIRTERMILEDQSTNTEENISFSKAYIGDMEQDSVVVVTNAFHIYRASRLCQKQGIVHVTGLGTKSSRIMVPAFYLREGIAVLKYKICGQI